MNFTAGENMSFQAGMNISSSATMNISQSAGASITESAGMNHSITAGGFMNQNSIGDYTLIAANIMEIANGERKSSAKETKEVSQKREILTEKDSKIHSQETFHNNAGEKTNTY